MYECVEGGPNSWLNIRLLLGKVDNGQFSAMRKVSPNPFACVYCTYSLFRAPPYNLSINFHFLTAKSWSCNSADEHWTSWHEAGANVVGNSRRLVSHIREGGCCFGCVPTERNTVRSSFDNIFNASRVCTVYHARVSSIMSWILP